MAFSIYCDPNPDVLFQGDLIQCSDELYELIRKTSDLCGEAKPDFLSIITQSCDLKKYKKKWKSEVTTISFAIKFKQHASTLINGMIANDIDRQLLQDKVINNRYESKITSDLCDVIQYRSHEFFLYHNDLSYKIEEDYYIHLRLTIPMQTEAFYGILLKNKVAQLTENFRDKLGYNVSYLFSRVGVDEPDKEFIGGIKSSVLSGYEIISKEVIAELEKSSHHKSNFNKIANARDRIDYISKIRVPSQVEIIESVLKKNVKEICGLSDEECKLFSMSVLNSSEIRSLLKTK